MKDHIITRVASAIEHTILKSESTEAEVQTICEEAIEHNFVGVCVNPVHTKMVSEFIDKNKNPDHTAPVVVTVVGFPLGASRSDMKAEEARRAMDDGALEIDMVVQLGALLAGDNKFVRKDIETVAAAVHQHHNKGLLKVILETGALTDDQIISACRCCAEGEADFIKTSTGFHPTGGATVNAVSLMHKHSAPIRVKASGGIRSAEDALNMLEAGAARLGSSSSVKIMQELQAKN